MIIELSPLGLLKISGNDAKKFLQGQLTCNMDEITPNQSHLGAHCNPQGRIISLFQIFIYNDNYHLLMPRELISTAIKALQKYAVFFKVSLMDVSTETNMLGYIDETPPPDSIQFPGSPTRYLIMNGSSQPTGAFDQWKLIDIQHDIPAIYPDTSEKFLPHELNLPALHAVSFNKGCYTGQEIIARMQYRGKLKNHLYRARITTAIPIIRGQDIYREKKSCGNLVDYCQIDDNNYELLIIAQDSDAQTNQLYVDSETRIEILWQKNYAL